MVQANRMDFQIPQICFGGSSLGNMPDTYGYAVEEERAYQTITSILNGPMPFLDTSRNYGMGRSEERIGSAIRRMGGLPEGAILSTKLDRDMQTGRFDADRARRSIEESLELLGVDHVDILHLHDPEYAADIEEVRGKGGALEALFGMKEEGLTRAVGLAMGRIDLMADLLGDWDVDALITHNRFTLLNREADPVIETAHARGIAVLNAAPYAGGILAKGTVAYPRYVYQDASERVLEPIRQIEAICTRHGIPLGAAALQFSMSDTRITATICGVTKAERVAQTLDWANWPIPVEFWQEIKEVPYSTGDPEADRDYKPG